MTYQEVLAAARTCSGPYCKACPVCNGKACGSTMPGPGSKGTGTVASRNYEAWQQICLNMDTICENKPVDTHFTFFGETYDLPVFAGPTMGTSTTTWSTTTFWSPHAPRPASPPSPATAPIPTCLPPPLPPSAPPAAVVSPP